MRKTCEVVAPGCTVRLMGETDSSGRRNGATVAGILTENTMADSKNTVEVTDDSFAGTVEKAPGLVLVDFWAEWCGPCKRLGPTIDALAAEYGDKVTVGKLNVDDNPNTAMKFQIRGIPAVMLFKGGQIVDAVVGLQPKDAFKQAIDKHL